MTDTGVPADAAAAAAPAAALAPPARWPAQVLGTHLAADDPATRAAALAIAAQPDSEAANCVEALLRCCALSAAQPMLLCHGAAVLGSLPRAAATPAVLDTLCGLTAPPQPTPVRVFATHALFRHGQMPAAAAPHVAALLADDEEPARQVALLALEPFAPQCAQPIVATVAAMSPERWTSEALAALALSAGTDAAARRRVEEFVTRAMQGAALLPTGIAAFAALARMDPHGPALEALVRAAAAGERAPALAALKAIGALGAAGAPAAPGLARLLAATDEPEREEALCRALVQIRAPAADLPVARCAQRIESAPDRAAAAHCMLLTLHPRQTGAAAPSIVRRAAGATPALLGVLQPTYKTLAGKDLPAVTGS